MPNNKTSIEVEAKGEFSQLTRGLREVKSSLGEVTKVVTAGARSGGFFSEDQVKSLDIFSRRFKTSMDDMTRVIDDQGEVMARLYKRRRDASQTDIETIDKEIKKHDEYLTALERERVEMERIYRLRKDEAEQFGMLAPKKAPRTPGGAPGGETPGGGGGRTPGGGGGGGETPGGGESPRTPGGPRLPRAPKPAPKAMPGEEEGGGFLGGALDKGLGGVLGKGLKAAGLLLGVVGGVALSVNQLMKWEQMAEQNVTTWQPMIQRTGMDRTAMTGVGQGYGFNSLQTAQALDIYSQTAGDISTKDASQMMAFSRGYGVDTNTAAGIAGQMSIRGYGGAGQVLGSAAGVADASNMSGRILEVLETSQAFLQSMDKNLKDNNGNSLLAYTARINQIGQANGAEKLTGQSGATMLEQMGNTIFNPSNTKWQTMGVNILSRYGGAQTKGMDSLELMKTWQQGFQNPANMKALGEYLGQATKGMTDKQSQEYKTVTLQEAMGGNTTLEQAEQFGKMTDWLKAFSPNDPKMQSLLKGGNGVAAQGDILGKSVKWQGTIAAKIEITNAKWFNAQEDAGEVTIPAKLKIEDFSADVLNSLTAATKKWQSSVEDAVSKGVKDGIADSLNPLPVVDDLKKHGVSSAWTDTHTGESAFSLKGIESVGKNLWGAIEKSIKGALGINTTPANSQGEKDTLSPDIANTRIQQELQKQGKGDWWSTVQTLLERESGTHNVPGATDPNDGQTPSGYFQFKPETWDQYMKKDGFGGSPMDYNPEIQTDAFIRYIEGRYGNIDNMVEKTGLGTSDYKGYAVGTYVNHDKVARIHGGEEVISRAKTGETLRKTGMLPSQVLNDYMNGGGGASPAPTAAGGATKRIALNVNFTGAEALAGMPIATIERVARQVFADAAFESQRPQVQF